MQRSDVRGVDHIGITVPDLDAAQQYFERVLGAEYIFDVLTGPVSGGALEASLGLPAGTTLNAIRHLRLGNGPNLELFSYSSADQRTPARPSDLGIQHFAVYVDDIEAVADRVRCNAGEVLGSIDFLPNAEAGPGNRYVYTRTPWGSTMELITYPSAQNYESEVPLRRWKPAEARQKELGQDGK